MLKKPILVDSIFFSGHFERNDLRLQQYTDFTVLQRKTVAFEMSRIKLLSRSVGYL